MSFPRNSISPVCTPVRTVMPNGRNASADREPARDRASWTVEAGEHTVSGVFHPRRGIG